jgi:hypothetical protein
MDWTSSADVRRTGTSGSENAMSTIALALSDRAVELTAERERGFRLLLALGVTLLASLALAGQIVRISTHAFGCAV